ncbi:MAG: NUDIX hydrolase [Oscillospiraceae bacterium]|nr:NUDIX hydrolase [Oscillospiraceae bacterium]
MNDILFHTNNYVFSYRVAGILVRDNKILLQKPTNDTGFAVPGGHVEFGETNAETLVREFKEEIGADITVSDLKWVAEIFFPWGNKPCHQICLYYDVTLKHESQIPLEGVFVGDEKIEGREFKIEFYWISVENLCQIEVYPTNIPDLMTRYHEGVQHFVYKEV